MKERQAVEDDITSNLLLTHRSPAPPVAIMYGWLGCQSSVVASPAWADIFAIALPGTNILYTIKQPLTVTKAKTLLQKMQGWLVPCSKVQAQD